jgi:hypothetical protein
MPQVVAVQFNQIEGIAEDTLLVVTDEIERGNAVVIAGRIESTAPIPIGAKPATRCNRLR